MTSTLCTTTSQPPTVQRVFVFVGPGGSRNPTFARRLQGEFNADTINEAIRSGDPYQYLIYWGVLMGTCRGHRCWQRASHRQTGSRPHLRPYLWRRCRERSPGNSRTLLEAVDYIFTKAAELGKSAVVNLSLGTHGPHDGSTLAEQGFDVC